MFILWVYLLALFFFVCVFRTPFGKEYELTAHTFLDSHKAERDNNHWLFFTAHPANQNETLMQLQQDTTVLTDEQRENQEDTQVKECS